MLAFCLIAVVATTCQETATPARELAECVARFAAADRGTYRYSPDVAAVEAAQAAASSNEAAGSRSAPKGRVARHTWEVTFASNGIAHYELGNAQFWKQGDALVVLTRREEWVSLDAALRAEWRASGDAEQRAIARMVADLTRIPSPASVVADLVSPDAAVVKEPGSSPPADPASAAAAPVDFVVTLTPAALDRLLRGEGVRRAGRSAAESPATPVDEGAPVAAQPDHGTLRVRVVAGAIVAFEIEARGRGASEPVAIRRRYQFEAWGTALLLAPAPVAELLAGK